jgi:D-alanine-D-alanine ligase
VAFLALHGSAGEDGTIQSLLELIGLPYTGPDVLASSIAWNKPIAQGLFARAGIAVPARVTLTQQAFREMGATAAVDRIADELGHPIVVKPATGGSSLGLTIVDEPRGCPRRSSARSATPTPCCWSASSPGPRWRSRCSTAQALPPVEIQPKEGAYDFAARYTAGATEFHVPARLDPDVLRACEADRDRAYDAVGARHISRADLIVDEGGHPWLLEIDTCPGLTRTSLAPWPPRPPTCPSRTCASGWSTSRCATPQRRDGTRAGRTGAGILSPRWRTWRASRTGRSSTRSSTLDAEADAEPRRTGPPARRPRHR